MSSLNLQSLLVFAVCAQLFAPCLAELMYPYGPAQGDTSMVWGYTYVPLAQSITFLGSEHNYLIVYKQGFIYLQGDVFVDAYYVVAGTQAYGGHVYYREVTSGPLLTTASNHVRQCNSGQSGFSATWVFVATWDRITYYGGDETTPTATFQAVLISDGAGKTFVMYNYKDIQFSSSANEYAWTGFEMPGDYFSIPGSGTAAVENIDLTKNCGPLGRWFFRVDGDEIVPGGPQGYDCTHNNPCTPANAAAGLFYFPYYDQSKYVQCGQWGSCNIRPCPSGLVFYPEYSVCGWP